MRLWFTTLAILTTIAVPANAEITITEDYRSCDAEAIVDGPAGYAKDLQGDMNQPDEPFSGLAFAESTTPDGYIWSRTTQESEWTDGNLHVEATAEVGPCEDYSGSPDFSCYGYSIGVVEIFFDTTEDTMFYARGLMSAFPTGFGGAFLELINTQTNATYVYEEIGSTIGVSGTIDINGGSILPPGQYLLHVEVATDGGPSSLTLDFEFGSATVPADQVSWTDVKSRFGR